MAAFPSAGLRLGILMALPAANIFRCFTILGGSAAESSISTIAAGRFELLGGAGRGRELLYC